MVLKYREIILEKFTPNMSAGKIFANKYIPKYIPEYLPWHKRDGLLTYIDQLKYKDFISDPIVHI